MSLPESSADAVAPAALPGTQRPPRIWKFIGTGLWGLLAFGAMFLGQIAVVVWFLLKAGAVDFAAAKALLGSLLGGGILISMSVLMGLPATLAALWLATRVARTPFAEYLA